MRRRPPCRRWSTEKLPRASWPSRTASILVGMLLGLSSLGAGASLGVVVRLLQEGRDVTSTRGNDVVRFFPVGEGPDGRLGEVTCLVKGGCEVPPGTYSVDLDGKDLVVETRPEIVVVQGGPKPVEALLNVAPAAHVTVPGLPVGGSLQALDQQTATLRSQSVSSPIAGLRIPARPQILCAFDPEARPLGCWPIHPRPSETVALPGLPRLPKGRGQLFVDFKYPSRDAQHDLSIALKVCESVHRADAVVGADPDRHFAVWYDVPSGPATLEVTSKLWMLAGPDSVEVLDRVLSQRKAIPLARRPSLNLRFLNPELLFPGAWAAVPGSFPVSRRDAEPGRPSPLRGRRDSRRHGLFRSETRGGRRRPPGGGWHSTSRRPFGIGSPDDLPLRPAGPGRQPGPPGARRDRLHPSAAFGREYVRQAVGSVAGNGATRGSCRSLTIESQASSSACLRRSARSSEAAVISRYRRSMEGPLILRTPRMSDHWR